MSSRFHDLIKRAMRHCGRHYSLLYMDTQSWNLSVGRKDPAPYIRGGGGMTLRYIVNTSCISSLFKKEPVQHLEQIWFFFCCCSNLLFFLFQHMNSSPGRLE